MNEDLKIIKKNYGENFAHLCRELFSTLLEQKGLLPKLLLSKFAPTHNLYNDIVKDEYEEEFKNYIYSLFDVEQKEIRSKKTVRELLSEAGYDFYECHSEEDIQSFKKYYAEQEELCTFNGNRLKKCYVFFAVKKDVEKIKREDFSMPNRQDKYGTSVISIQFSRGSNNTLSIKNRYNHRVNNPDATFSNNLENIIPGLTAAFEREYRLKINQIQQQDFELYNYVMGNNKKFYRYNFENNNIYYCENNIIVANGEVIELDKSRYLLMDYFIIDLKEKKVNIFDIETSDSFINCFDKIDKIEIINEQENKIVRIKSSEKKDIIIEINKYGQIIEFSDLNITNIGNDFLRYNSTLEKIEIPNIETIGDNYLKKNKTLKKIEIPKLKKVGKGFLTDNKNIEELNLPNLEETGDEFLSRNIIINSIYIPKLKYTGNLFLTSNKKIIDLHLPNLEQVGTGFLGDNEIIENIYIPKLKKVDNMFLSNNKELKEINLPALEEVKTGFLWFNKKLKKVILPNLKKAGSLFLKGNKELEEINLPNLEEVGENFISSNNKIEYISLPKLKKIGSYFMYQNTILKDIDLPSLIEISEYNSNLIIDIMTYNRKGGLK